MPKEKILVIATHPDDEVIGMGGTLAKYAKEKKDITIINLSSGVYSHPWLKEEITKEMRIKEGEKAAKLFGIKKPLFFDLKDQKLVLELKDEGVRDKLKKLLKDKKPDKIFTHSFTDAHHDHRAVNKFVNEILDEIKYKKHLLVFDIWNPMEVFNIFKKDVDPKLYVNITDTFDLKMKAIHLFESQKAFTYLLLPFIYLQARINGIKNGCKYAEVFHKER